MPYPKAVNYILFQVGWFACVLGAANNLSLLGIMLALLVVFVYLYTSTTRSADALALLIITVVGYAWDSLLVQLGVFTYNDSYFDGLAPLWIAAIWAIFGTTLNSSLAWLQGRYWLAFTLGGVFGPIAYFSASKLGAVVILPAPQALLMQAIAWSILMPAMLLCIKYTQRTISVPNKERV